MWDRARRGCAHTLHGHKEVILGIKLKITSFKSQLVFLSDSKVAINFKSSDSNEFVYFCTPISARVSHKSIDSRLHTLINYSCSSIEPSQHHEPSIDVVAMIMIPIGRNKKKLIKNGLEMIMWETTKPCWLSRAWKLSATARLRHCWWP